MSSHEFAARIGAGDSAGDNCPTCRGQLPAPGGQALDLDQLGAGRQQRQRLDVPTAGPAGPWRHRSQADAPSHHPARSAPLRPAAGAGRRPPAPGGRPSTSPAPAGSSASTSTCPRPGLPAPWRSRSQADRRGLDERKPARGRLDLVRCLSVLQSECSQADALGCTRPAAGAGERQRLGSPTAGCLSGREGSQQRGIHAGLPGGHAEP
jgi:hypothetical protein